MALSDRKMPFWDAVTAAQEHALSGDKDRAINALLAARREAAESGGDLSEERTALLRALIRTIAPGHEDLLEDAPNMAPAVQRIAVSGIGRSGTTLIYQQIAKLLLLADRRVNFRYEPYLWNIRSPEAKGNPFDMSQLHHFGLMVHTGVPLFLEGGHPLHDPFVDHLFDAPWDRNPQQGPDAHLTKVIRGSGRLRSYLARFPDLRIVACLRNPVDTINSSLGMFSFFGEEFHPDDRPRFRDELAARGADVTRLGQPDLSIEWYAQWWQAFTEETLAVAQDYPENVFPFCYEAFQEKPEAMLEALMDFVGLRNLGMFMGLSKPAGPTIKATSLTQHDIRVLGPQIDYYTDRVLVPRLGAQAALARTDKTVSRYLGGRFSFPIAGSDLGRKCPIQLRGMMLNGAGSPFLSLAKRPANPVDLAEMIAQHHEGDPAEMRKPAESVARIKGGKRFGAVITCHNNQNTVADAVLSCLNQTLPFDEIVVVDDKSTDNSRQILAELETRYSNLRVLALPSNLGPSGARDLGIRELTTEFFTQLDGDDLYWPSKNAQEAAALAGDESAVAFSDILVVRPGQSHVQSVAAYDGRTGAEAWTALMARTPQIPRDMTLSRKLYFEVGGYDMTRHLYEDWEFKLRLAARSRAWIRAQGTAGTVYNRLSPGLSGVEDGLHARALSQIFLSGLGQAYLPKEAILQSYDAMIGRFADRNVAVRSRQALETFIARGLDLVRLAEHVSRRDTCAMDNMDYAASLDKFVAENLREEVSA
ncbi:MAG: hypothetical protein CMN16_19790 [Roseovarius sp.]|nr:hypothetical protein [Roseovarius sp.]